MLTNDRDALYAAILANPDDDAPRLVFADYLDENGEPERATYIRKSIEREQCDPLDEAYDAVHQECLDLERLYAKKLRWFPRLHKDMRFPEVNRGFTNKFSCSIPLFLKHAAKLYATIPLTNLNIGETNPTDDQLRELCASPHVGPLRTLSTYHNYLTDASVMHLVASPQVGRLRKLDLWGNRLLTAVGIRHLMAAPTLTNLCEMDLPSTDCGDEGALALASTPRYAQFTRVSMWKANLSSDGVALLLNSKYNRQIRSLELFSNPNIREDAGPLFAKSRKARHLRELDLKGSSLGRDGMTAILTSRNLEQLRQLDLSEIPAIDTLAGLRQKWTLPNLQSLHLGELQLKDDDIAALFQNNPLPRLETLWLTENKIGSVGLAHIAAQQTLTNLRTLNLCYNQITSRGVIALAASPLCQRLEWLHLGCNRIDDKGAQAILDSTYLANIPRLTIFDNKISIKMRNRLKRRFGKRVMT